MVRLLLERRVDVNTQGKHHLTPLHVAAHYKHPNVAALLLDNHADPHRVAKVNNEPQPCRVFTLSLPSCPFFSHTSSLIPPSSSFLLRSSFVFLPFPFFALSSVAFFPFSQQWVGWMWVCCHFCSISSMLSWSSFCFLFLFIQGFFCSMLNNLRRQPNWGLNF